VSQADSAELKIAALRALGVAVRDPESVRRLPQARASLDDLVQHTGAAQFRGTHNDVPIYACLLPTREGDTSPRQLQGT